MTSDEIRNAIEDFRSEKGWLKEIAYQLALRNERRLSQAFDISPKTVPEPSISATSAQFSSAENSPRAEKSSKAKRK